MTPTAPASAVRRLDHLANLDHLTAHDVLELVRAAAWPSVTILLDTTPAEGGTVPQSAPPGQTQRGSGQALGRPPGRFPRRV